MKITFIIFLFLPCMVSATSLDVQGVVFKSGHPLPGECLELSIEDADQGLEHLAKTLQIMKEYPELDYEVVGHSDTNECRIDECKLLSKRRAQLVAKFFIDAGIDPVRLSEPHGAGVDKPLGITGSPSNRSVEVNIIN